MAAETIIESFCERCGTRYTFEPVRKRESKLVGIGKSLGILLDAPGSGSASRDPFHGTFHFCLECRQYTCPSCWNEPAGFCQGCVPLPDAPDTAALEAAEAAASDEATSWMDDELAQHAALDHPEAWPDADLHRRRLEAREQMPTGIADDPVASALDELLPEDESRSLTFEPVPVATVAATDRDALAAAVILDVVDDEPDAALVADDLAEAVQADETADTDLEADAEPGLVADAELADAALEADLAEDAMVDAAGADDEADAAVIHEDAPTADAGVLQAEALETEAVEVDADADAATMATEEAVESQSDLSLAAGAEVQAIDIDAEEADAPSPEAATDEPPAAAEVAALEPGVQIAAAHADDQEADWADLLNHLPVIADEDVASDDWSAMAPALGPDIAPTQAPIVAPIHPVAPPAPMPTAAPQPSWQLTAPVRDTEPRPTPWPPLGPVFRPSSPPTSAPSAPHPSVLAPRPRGQGVLARGAQAGALAQLPNGVRPCVSCELPLSASARFCRRCGRPQD